MKQKIDEIIQNTPSIIKSHYEIEHPNSPIEIHMGQFILNQDEKSVKLNGRIFFDWFTQHDVKFEGEIVESTDSPINMFSNDDAFELEIDGIKFGKALLQNISYGQNSNVSGLLHAESVLGDKTISVTKINFAIPNLKEFFGDSVKVKNEKGGIKLCKNRIELENEDYTIVIDKSPKYKTLSKELSKKGGFAILYAGELTKKKGSIQFSELKELIHCFSVFLTFLNGRRCAPLFLQGIHDEEVIWTDFTGYQVHQYKSVVSWSPKLSIVGFNEFWQQFSKLWKTTSDKDFLVSVVHWYVESNGNSGYLEGSIIMSQVALELIYNWLVIEKRRLLIGKDGENISAANKIRLLLAQVKCKIEVPVALDSLERFIKENNELDDGVDAFVQIRNAIIHSQEEKERSLLTEVTQDKVLINS